MLLVLCGHHLHNGCTCDAIYILRRTKVVSLPGGTMLVIDAWSTGGTRVVKHLDNDVDAFPASVPERRVAFALPPGGRGLAGSLSIDRQCINICIYIYNYTLMLQLLLLASIGTFLAESQSK